jgi:hypothetical protein
MSARGRSSVGCSLLGIVLPLPEVLAPHLGEDLLGGVGRQALDRLGDLEDGVLGELFLGEQ